MIVIETLFIMIVKGETERWRGVSGGLCCYPLTKTSARTSTRQMHLRKFFGSRFDCIRNQRPIIPAAQASTAIPITILYIANGAKPRLRTQAMNQATAP
jgi:hypothetical protein